MGPNHEYSIKELKTPFGNGIEVSEKGSRDYYQQIKSNDGLIARIFSTEENHKRLGNKCISVISKYPFKDNKENHLLFRELTGKLNKIQDETINSGSWPLKIYTDQGLEKKLGNGTTIRINKEDKKEFPKEAYNFVDGVGYFTGNVAHASSFMIYLTTLGLSIGHLLANTTVSNWLWHAPLYTATTIFSLFGELDYMITKECIKDMGDTKPSVGVTYWIAHTIGVKLATSNFEERLRKKDYALKKFLLSHKSAKRAISDNHMGYVYFKDEKWADRREKWNREHRD
ncbi:hypothetical protein COY26_02255, partial [Candidatus Woesearchaeota archaeon CG_4_10_14_0_2_um_filter_33_10]